MCSRLKALTTLFFASGGDIWAEMMGGGKTQQGGRDKEAFEDINPEDKSSTTVPSAKSGGATLLKLDVC